MRLAGIGCLSLAFLTFVPLGYAQNSRLQVWESCPLRFLQRDSSQTQILKDMPVEFLKRYSRFAPSMCRPPLWSRENETTVPRSHSGYTRQDLRHLRTPQL